MDHDEECKECKDECEEAILDILTQGPPCRSCQKDQVVKTTWNGGFEGRAET